MQIANREGFAAEARRRLPYDARVAYLQSTSAQWIDTGYAFQDNFAWEIRCTTPNYNEAVLGGRASSIRSSLLFRISGGNGMTVPIGSMNGLTTPFVFSEQDGDHVYKFAAAAQRGSAWLDGAQLYNNVSFSGTYISDVNHVLFADNFGGGSISEFASCRIYYFKAWQSGTLVRDMIPVRFTNELGQSEGAMYDRANPTVGMNPNGSARTDGLYRNRGTGAFTTGPDKTA